MVTKEARINARLRANPDPSTVGMTFEEKAAEAFRLHVEKGWGRKRIARHFGVDKNGARNLVGRACPECGGRMGFGSARCRGCYGHPSGPRVWERRALIVGMWAGGLSIREIAAELGSSPGAIGVDLWRFRQEGLDLPLRRRPRR